MSILTIQECRRSDFRCRKCGEDAPFKVIYGTDCGPLTLLCRACCQEFVKYFSNYIIDTTAMVEKCETCGQTIKEHKSP